MKISIIIPVYQVEPYIQRCLRSALDQSYPEKEIILVDDCGTDASMALAQQVMDTHPTGKVVRIIRHTENRGLSAARNTGINAAHGDYLYFLDSDDFIAPNCLTALAEAAKHYRPDFIVGDYRVLGSNEPYPPLRIKGYLASNEEVLMSYLSQDIYMMAWNKLINRQFLIKNKLYFKEGIVHEDNLWSFQVACTAGSAFAVPITTYLYCIQENSITQKSSLNRFKSYISIIEQMVSFVKRQPTLRQNHNVYHFIENLKSFFLYKIFTSQVSDNFKRSAYLYARNNNYKNVALYLLKRKWHRSEERIKFYSKLSMHYLLPPRLGFIHYRKAVLTQFRET